MFNTFSSFGVAYRNMADIISYDVDCLLTCQSYVSKYTKIQTSTGRSKNVFPLEGVALKKMLISFLEILFFNENCPDFVVYS